MTVETDESSEIVTSATNNMPIEMNRRKFMTVATGASTAVLAGCTGSAGADVVLEYSYEEGDPGQDTIPQDVKDAAETMFSFEGMPTNGSSSRSIFSKESCTLTRLWITHTSKLTLTRISPVPW